METDPLRETLENVLKRLEALEHRIDAIEGERRPSPVTKWAAPKATIPAEFKPPILPPPPPLLRESTPVVSEPPNLQKVIANTPAAAPRSDGLGQAERFIGAKLIGWIGAIALLVGVSLFLKLAFDRGWIGPGLRIVMGAAAGIVLFGSAEWLFRRKLNAFAASAAGGGMGILILTNWAAFSLYGFTSFPAAFAIGSAITAAGFAWSVARSLVVTLILAQIAGFLTPLLIPKETTGPYGLAIYLAALGAASCAAGQFRSWRSPAMVSLLATIFVYSGWIIQYQSRVRSEWAVDTACAVSILSFVYLIDLGIRARRKQILAAAEAAAVLLICVWVAVFFQWVLHSGHARTEGWFLLLHSAALAAICYISTAASREFRAAALIFTILGTTAALERLFDGLPLGIAWIAWAAALSALELKTKSYIPLLGAMFVHALILTFILQWGSVDPERTFAWTERTTLSALEAASLYFTSRLFRNAEGARQAAGRAAFAVLQAMIAFLFWELLPENRVTFAWTLQSLVLAWIFSIRRIANNRAAIDAAVLSGVVFVFATFHFLSRNEFTIPADATVIVNFRALSILAAAGVFYCLWRSFNPVSSRTAELREIPRFAAIFCVAIFAASEACMLLFRDYGISPRAAYRDLLYPELLYQPFWNGRFVFLLIFTLFFASAARILRREKGPDEFKDAGGSAAVYTILAHVIFLAAVSMEAMGIANPWAGANPTKISDLTNASGVHAALSITLFAIPAAALAIGFKRSRVHRYYGLAGLLAAVVKVVLVDLSNLALEWRMLVLLALGAVLLAGAYLYSRAARAKS
ncbi:MAG: DUF2339 domain-containing protein [Planctomycetota bacterium]